MHARRTARAVRQMVVNHGWAAAVRTARDRLRRKLRRRSPPADTTTWLPTARARVRPPLWRGHQRPRLGRRISKPAAPATRGTPRTTQFPRRSFTTPWRRFRRRCGGPPHSSTSAAARAAPCCSPRSIRLREVVGVEIAPQLHRVAVDNVARYTAARQAEGRNGEPPVEVLLEDAAQYRFPAGPLVLYLYHPFCRPVLEQVMANLSQSLAQEPRAGRRPLHQSRAARCLDRAPFLQQVWSATVAMDANDRLADRVGSSAEDCAVYLTV